jgi:Outer membrane protein beta-barrel domain
MSASNPRSIYLLFGLLLSLSLSAFAQDPTPGFNSSWRNADGSLKPVAELATGYNISAGASRKDQGAGWHYRIGGGYRLNRRLAALIEYNYDHLHVPGSALGLIQGSGNVAATHLWSFTLEPTFQYFSTQHLGGYLIGGGGFYRKVIVFETVSQCSTNCGFAPNNSTGAFSNNAGGANLGAGFAWRVWDRSNAKLFTEARYVWVDNTKSPNPAVLPYHTGYFPITAGVRW